MKTQYINIGQALSGAYSLMIAAIAGLDWNKVSSVAKLSPGKAGNYVFTLLKQLFRDSFTSSETEMEMLLLFAKNYFLLAVFVISQVALALRFNRSSGSTNTSTVNSRGNLYQHKQAAGNWGGQILVS